VLETKEPTRLITQPIPANALESRMDFALFVALALGCAATRWPTSWASTAASSLNYGYNNVRVIRPLLIGERFKDTVTVKDVIEKRPGDYLVTDQHTFVKEGRESPFLVLEKLGYFTTGYEEKWRPETTVKR
jgi:hypothetical protein